MLKDVSRHWVFVSFRGLLLLFFMFTLGALSTTCLSTNDNDLMVLNGEKKIVLEFEDR